MFCRILYGLYGTERLTCKMADSVLDGDCNRCKGCRFGATSIFQDFDEVSVTQTFTTTASENLSARVSVKVETKAWMMMLEVDMNVVWCLWKRWKCLIDSLWFSELWHDCTFFSWCLVSIRLSIPVSRASVKTLIRKHLYITCWL